MKYVCLRNCLVRDVLWKESKVYELPDDFPKDPKNFRPQDVPAELHVEVTEDALNDEHEQKLKVENKPEHIPDGHYWCTECQGVHNGNPNKNNKISKIAKKHLKFRA